LARGAECPVKGNDHGEGCGTVISGGHVYVITAPDAAYSLVNRYLVSSLPQRRRRVRRRAERCGLESAGSYDG
jgi:hypothetical protein